MPCIAVQDSNSGSQQHAWCKTCRKVHSTLHVGKTQRGLLAEVWFSFGSCNAAGRALLTPLGDHYARSCNDGSSAYSEHASSLQGASGDTHRYGSERLVERLCKYDADQRTSDHTSDGRMFCPDKCPASPATDLAMGQNPVPPVNIPFRLKWVVHLPQNGIPLVLTHGHLSSE